jgi:adenine phosphoribosyltransferase
VKAINCFECNLPEQPIVDPYNNGFYFAKERMNFAKKTENFDNYDYVVSIESVVDISLYSIIEDQCCVLIYSKGILAHGTSFGINFDAKYFEELEKNHEMVHYNNKIYGYKTTVGKLMSAENPLVDHRNWMKPLYNVDRVDQIKDGIIKALAKLNKYENTRDQINDYYKTYVNYPTPGITFHDIFPLFNDKKIFRLMIKYIANHYRYDNITHVVGLESRGFCVGIAIAYELKIGFIPIRKAGKLPGNVIQITYEKEYGPDSFEMQQDIEKDARVLIIDDLIATGGSMRAAVDLVTQIGCIIIDCCVLKDVSSLKEICNKTMNIPYTVLIQEKKLII